MTIGHLLQLTGLIMGFVSAMLLTITEIKTKKEREHEAGTYFDKNPYLEKALKQKSLLAVISTILLAISFVIQLVGLAIG